MDTIRHSNKPSQRIQRKLTNELVVKRVKRALEGNISLISDNAVYERRTISLDEFTNMKVIGAIHYIFKEM